MMQGDGWHVHPSGHLAHLGTCHGLPDWRPNQAVMRGGSGVAGGLLLDVRPGHFIDGAVAIIQRPTSRDGFGGGATDESQLRESSTLTWPNFRFVTRRWRNGRGAMIRGGGLEK